MFLPTGSNIELLLCCPVAADIYRRVKATNPKGTIIVTNHDDTTDQSSAEPTRTPREIIADFRRLRSDYNNQPPEVQKLIDDATTGAELSKMLRGFRERSLYQPLRPYGHNIIPEKLMPEINGPDWLNHPGDESAGSSNFGNSGGEYYPEFGMSRRLAGGAGQSQLPFASYEESSTQLFDPQPAPTSEQADSSAETDTSADAAGGETETRDLEN